MKLRQFVVSGRGTFPFDMLRYDACFPRGPEDSALMGETEHRSVTLVTISQSAPTIARWNSFNWSCTEGENYY